MFLGCFKFTSEASFRLSSYIGFQYFCGSLMFLFGLCGRRIVFDETINALVLCKIEFFFEGLQHFYYGDAFAGENINHRYGSNQRRAYRIIPVCFSGMVMHGVLHFGDQRFVFLDRFYRRLEIVCGFFSFFSELSFLLGQFAPYFSFLWHFQRTSMSLA